MAAAVVPFLSVEQYLHTVYEPDMDYVDGELEDRNAGSSIMLGCSVHSFCAGSWQRAGGYFVVQELRGKFHRRDSVFPTRVCYLLTGCLSALSRNRLCYASRCCPPKIASRVFNASATAT